MFTQQGKLWLKEVILRKQFILKNLLEKKKFKHLRIEVVVINHFKILKDKSTHNLKETFLFKNEICWNSSKLKQVGKNRYNYHNI